MAKGEENRRLLEEREKEDLMVDEEERLEEDGVAVIVSPNGMVRISHHLYLDSVTSPSTRTSF